MWPSSMQCPKAPTGSLDVRLFNSNQNYWSDGQTAEVEYSCLPSSPSEGRGQKHQTIDFPEKNLTDISDFPSGGNLVN